MRAKFVPALGVVAGLMMIVQPSTSVAGGPTLRGEGVPTESTSIFAMSDDLIQKSFPDEFAYLASEFKLSDHAAADAVRTTELAGEARLWASSYINGYAGTWIDYPSTVYVGVAGGAEDMAVAQDAVRSAALPGASSVTLVAMPRSFNELLADASDLRDAVQKWTKSTVIVTVDERDSALVVDGDKTAGDAQRQPAVRDLISRSTFPVVTWKASTLNAPTDVHGGWDARSTPVLCTMAFTAVSASNSRAVLTAGHCGDGAPNYGSVTLSTAQYEKTWWPPTGSDPANRGWDRQLHVVPAGNASVAYLDAPAVNISGTFLPAQGSALCRYGASSVQNGQSPAFCTTVTGYDSDGLVAMSVGCIGGDSGGPSWVLGKAVGIAAATNDYDWPVDSSSTCFEAPVKDQFTGTPYFLQDARFGFGADFSQLGLYHPIDPTRILDTRGGSGVSGSVTVPLNAALNYNDLGAALLSVTMIPRTVGGYGTVSPGDNGFVPGYSNVNYGASGTGSESNFVISRVNRYSHSVSIYTSQNVDLVVDAIGYFSDTSGGTGAGAGLRSIPLTTPYRAYDSRPSDYLVAGTSRDIQIRGVGGVPTSAVAAIINVTVTSPTGSGFITVHEGSTSPPNTSNLNFTAGQKKARLAVATLDASGRIRLTAGGTSNELFIVDILGYMEQPASSSSFGRTFATDGGGGRILDTRPGSPLPAGGSACVDVYDFRKAETNGIPREKVLGVWLNVTATGANGGGYLTVYGGTTPPSSSNLNYDVGVARANAVFVKLPSISNGTVCFSNYLASTDVIADVLAYSLTSM